ncbi:hypothetical protein ScPMuIL_013842 [Solemya velum]
MSALTSQIGTSEIWFLVGKMARRNEQFFPMYNQNNNREIYPLHELQAARRCLVNILNGSSSVIVKRIKTKCGIDRDNQRIDPSDIFTVPSLMTHLPQKPGTETTTTVTSQTASIDDNKPNSNADNANIKTLHLGVHKRKDVVSSGRLLRSTMAICRHRSFWTRMRILSQRIFHNVLTCKSHAEMSHLKDDTCSYGIRLLYIADKVTRLNLLPQKSGSLEDQAAEDIKVLKVPAN